MVRGSGSESGDKESTKCSYDGTLKRWPPGKIKLKSALFKAGLWDVVEKGPSAAQTQPESIVPGYESTTPQGWYYAGRDNKVQGPCSAEELTKVFNNILQSEGYLEGESVYVHHADNTSGDWAPWSESVSRKVHVQSSISSPTCASFAHRTSHSGEMTLRCANCPSGRPTGAAVPRRRLPRLLHAIASSASSAPAPLRMTALPSTS